MRNDEPRTVTSARVVRWEGDQWGVLIRYSNRTRSAYAVGDRDKADAELDRLRGGSPASVPKRLPEPVE
jgi:hypothetical protein